MELRIEREARPEKIITVCYLSSGGGPRSTGEERFLSSGKENVPVTGRGNKAEQVEKFP